jgi:hypothetical protein
MFVSACQKVAMKRPLTFDKYKQLAPTPAKCGTGLNAAAKKGI